MFTEKQKIAGKMGNKKKKEVEMEESCHKRSTVSLSFTWFSCRESGGTVHKIKGGREAHK